MGGPGKLLAVGIVSSVVIGLMYGNMPGAGLMNPFTSADASAAADLEVAEERQQQVQIAAGAACVLGAAALGALAAIPTLGLGTVAIIGAGVGGCIGGFVGTGLATGENPVAGVPLVGDIADLAFLVIAYIGWLLWLLAFGLGPDAPVAVNMIVTGCYAGALGWHIVRLVRGSPA